jgi:GDP-fucose transporter C1
MGESLYIASVVGTYWVVSISMVYLNKILMSSEGVSIDAPLFITWFQCVVTCLICWAAGVCGEQAQNGYTSVSTSEASKSGSAPPSFFAQFPKAEYKTIIAMRVFPLSVVFVCMITFNNLCLKWVEVSFYNVARSFTIVFNVLFSSCFLGQKTSTNTIFCLLVVIVGFFIGATGELNLSIKGTLAGVTASLFVSLNSIFTKKILSVVEDNHWRLTFYNNMNATFLFLPLILIFERNILVEAINDQLANPVFWSAMCVAGFFGFSIGIVTVLQIKATSPLSHNISGTAKAAVQSMMAFYIWGNAYTAKGIAGIFTVLGGSLLYTHVKMAENRKMTSNVSETEMPEKKVDENV